MTGCIKNLECGFNPNKFKKFEVRWQNLKKKRVNRQNYLRSINAVLLQTSLF
jgi:hypothetical protein